MSVQLVLTSYKQYENDKDYRKIGPHNLYTFKSVFTIMCHITSMFTRFCKRVHKDLKAQKEEKQLTQTGSSGLFFCNFQNSIKYEICESENRKQYQTWKIKYLLSIARLPNFFSELKNYGMEGQLLLITYQLFIYFDHLVSSK